MITILTDSNNDIQINDSYSVTMATGIDAVKASCEYAVKTMMGELILQGDDGVPNFQLIWNGAPNIAQAENAIREVLLKVDNVTGVSEISAFAQNNVLKYSATITTTFGEAQLGL